MDDMKLRKLEEREEILRETFEAALLSLDRNAEVSVEQVKLMRSLAEIWMAARHLVDCEKKAHPVAGALKLKE